PAGKGHAQTDVLEVASHGVRGDGGAGLSRFSAKGRSDRRRPRISKRERVFPACRSSQEFKRTLDYKRGASFERHRRRQHAERGFERRLYASQKGALAGNANAHRYRRETIGTPFLFRQYIAGKGTAYLGV